MEKKRRERINKSLNQLKSFHMDMTKKDVSMKVTAPYCVMMWAEMFNILGKRCARDYVRNNNGMVWYGNFLFDIMK